MENEWLLVALSMHTLVRWIYDLVCFYILIAHWIFGKISIMYANSALYSYRIRRYEKSSRESAAYLGAAFDAAKTSPR